MLTINGMIRLKTFVLLISIYGLTACSSQSVEQALAPSENDQAQQQFHPYDVNTYSLNKVVCDPMGGGGNSGVTNGLIAELYWLEQSKPKYNHVHEYIDNGIRSTQKLFFTDLNVPTRVFDQGFPSETGDVIKDDMGETLIEYFALRFKSQLKLGPNDEEGDYELAILSDDGSMMKFISEEGEESWVVDNDGIHPSQMGCGDVVSFDKDTLFDVRLDYYQGPRHHISLIPMWRKVDENTESEKECGLQGNGRYFDFNHGSKPKKQYLDMLARGWKPIAPENWHLPPSSIFNPCVSGTPATISNFQVIKMGEEAAVATWETDLPTTSQVLYKDGQGNETMTTSDNILRTSHSVVIEGLQVGQTYTFQGVSITVDMGKTLSRIRQLTF